MNREVRGALAGGGWKKAFSMPAPKKNLFHKSEFYTTEIKKMQWQILERRSSVRPGSPKYIHQIEWCNHDNARNKITKSITLAYFSTCIKQISLSCFWLYYTYSFFSFLFAFYFLSGNICFVIELIWHGTPRLTILANCVPRNFTQYFDNKCLVLSCLVEWLLTKPA